MIRILKYVGISILLLLLAIIALAGWIIGTDKGTAWALDTAQSQLPALTIDHDAGNLWQGLALKHVNWAPESGPAVTLNALQTQWDFTCIQSQNLFCLNKLHVEEVLVKLPPATTEEEPPSSDAPIELPEIALPVGVDIQDLKIGLVRIDTGTGEPQEIKDIALQLKAEEDMVTLGNLSLAYAEHTAKASGTVQLQGDYPINLQLKTHSAPLIEGQNQDVTLTLKNSVAKLDIDALLNGAFDLTLKGNAQPLEKTLPFATEIAWDTLQWPPQSGQVATLTNGTIHLDGSLEGYALKIASHITGEQIPESNIRLAGKGDLNAFTIETLNLGTLEGDVDLTGDVQWAPFVKWDAQLALKQINPGSKWPEFPGKISGLTQVEGQLKDEKLQFKADNIDISGTLREHPLKLTGTAEQNAQGHLLFEHIELLNGKNRITAHGALREKWDLKGDLNLPQLDTLAPDLSGVLAGHFELTGPQTTPTIDLDLSGKAIRYAEHVIKQLSLKAHVPELAKQSSTLALQASDISTAGQVIHTLSLKADGTQSDHRLTADMDAKDAQVNLRVSGGMPDPQQWSGLLESANIKGFEHDLRLTQPTQIRWTATTNNVFVDAHCWQQKSANLCLQEPLNAGASGQGKVQLEGYKLAWLKNLLPPHLQLEGDMQLQSQFAWAPEQQPQLKLATEISSGKFGSKATETEPALAFTFNTLKLTADAAKQVAATIQLDSKDLGKTDIDVTLDPYTSPRRLQGNVNLQDLDLAFVKALAPQIKTITGILAANGKLSGTLQQPLFHGDLTLNGLNVASPDIPLGIEQGKILLRVAGTSAKLEGGWQSGGKPLTLNGDANWASKDWQANVALKGDKINIQQKPLIKMRLSPDIKVRATPKQIDIDGVLAIPYARVVIKKLSPSATSLSRDAVIVQKEPKAGPVASTGPKINSNVKIVLGRDVRFNGFDLRIKLEGDLKVAQSKQGEVDVTGEVEVTEGVYTAYGQDLKVDQGRLTFVGPIPATGLDITAYRSVRDIIAGVKVRGTIEAPEITLYGEPAMPQADALSYIVLGRLPSQKAEDGNLLANAALSMGLAGSAGLASDIASQFGIQDFQMEAAGSGDNTQVVVSGRVSENLLVKYGVGVFTPVKTLTLRYDLTEKLYLEASQGIESALDLFYSFEF